MENIENESWWDEEKSFQGQEKMKESREKQLENLSHKINQLTNGKQIYLKIQPSIYRNSYNSYSRDLDSVSKQKYSDYYNEPIAFNFGKFESDYFKIKLQCTLIGTEKIYGNIFTKDKTLLRKYYGSIDLHFSRNYETLKNISFHLGGSQRNIFGIEFITKESAQFLFEINKIIDPNFVPSMTAIKSESSDRRGYSTILIKSS